jgi:Family of unknown function (DUF5996)
LTDRTPADAWPDLPLEAWKDTKDTLHMLTQVAGKLRLARTPLVNHWWNATLAVTARGLGTGPIPHGGAFQLDFDLVDHRIVVTTSGSGAGAVPLRARPVAETYRELGSVLTDLGIDVPIWTMPVEVEDPVPFDDDRVHSAYDPAFATRFARILLQATRVLQEFRARFLGKSSPVHFFWGSFDLAVTRFSGRAAPRHPAGIPHIADHVVREAYSHEVSSAGWWPGGGAVAEPAFYAYAYPEPPGFAAFPVRPAAAFYHPELREFVLPYDAVRRAPDPDRLLLDFLQTTYEAAAGPGGWDRAALERPAGE